MLHYGLSYNPFCKEMVNNSSLFLSRDVREMNGRLKHLAATRGLGVFTSMPGAGKTLVLRCFMSELDKSLFLPKYIPLSTVSVRDFYRQWCEALGIESSGSKTVMFRNMQEQMLNMYKNKHQVLFLVLDEAQYLSNPVLTDLKMILNFESDSLNCVCLVLCGEPHLIHTFYTPVHEALRQRITVHYNFCGLQNDEIPQYVRHKIIQAGGSAEIIDDAALSTLTGQSNGIARVVDDLMTDALMIGEQMNKAVIDSDIILAAVENRNL